MSNIFCKGYTWGWCANSNEFQTKAAQNSMEILASNGLDWICIPVNAFQETFSSTTIFPLYEITQTDEDIIFAIKKAKSLGLKVCLKPVVNCLDHAWRAHINFPAENQNYWNKWFDSYKRFIIHYAKIAQSTECEMLCTGCEMAGMDSQSEHCLKLISKVRETYKGLIMHNINHGDEFRFDWLNAVDIIGISAYYKVSSKEDKSLEYMKNCWTKVVDKLEEMHEHYKKPIMFAEVGVRNEAGCTQHPYDFTHRKDVPLDEDEQANFYESAMWATWNKPWFAGYFWWDWKATLDSIDKVHENRDFTIYGKKAESVLKKWYTI